MLDITKTISYFQLNFGMTGSETLHIGHGGKFPRTKNHMNGIEGFWSSAKHVLYNHRDMSKYRLPMYLKEIEYRVSHRSDNLLLLFAKIYFGHICT
jgi:hypothetical protein